MSRYYFWLGRESYRVEAKYAHTMAMKHFPKTMARLHEAERIEADGFITVYPKTN